MIGTSSLLVLSTFLLALGEQEVGKYNQLLDPGRLSWWKTKWAANPIELSKTNQGATGVTITFFFNPAMSIYGGFLEVTCPKDFVLTGSSLIPVTYQGGEDTTAALTGVTLPGKEGAYGPFALKSRMSETGQIIDANLNFAMVYVTAKEESLTTASVNFAVAGSNTVRKESVDLSFSFTLTQNLWSRDYIKITIDKQFSLNLSDKNCTSVDRSGVTNNFIGVHADATHMLDCVASSKIAGQSQVLWVYGLAVDVTLQTGNSILLLRVPAFTNPDRAYPKESFKWTVETVRFGTGQTLEKFDFSGPEVVAAVLTTATWKPTWGLSTKEIPTRLEIYTDFSFVTLNTVPKGGSIFINLGTEEIKNSECYVASSIGLPSCVYNTSTKNIEVTKFSELAAGTTVALRFITVVKSSGGSKSSATVTTKDASGLEIDKGSTLGVFTVAGMTTVIYTKMTVLLYDRNGNERSKAGGTGDSMQGIVFKFEELSANVVASSNFEILCPFSAAVDDFQIYVPSFSLEYKDSADTTFSSSTGTVGGAPASNHGTVPVLKMGTPTQTSGQQSFAPGILTFSAGSYQVAKSALTFGLFSSAAIMLPRVASNVATAYECRVHIINSAQNSKAEVVGVAQFVVNPQEAQVTHTYMCASGSLSGSPLKVTFSPAVLELLPSSETKTYYLEIGMPDDYPMFHNSGVADGGSYPVDSSLSKTIKMILSTNEPLPSGSHFSHLVFGLDLVPVGSSVDIYFPVAGRESIKPTVSVQTFFTLQSDLLQTRYIIHVGTYGDYQVGEAISAETNVASPIAVQSNALVNGSSVGATLSFKAFLNSSITGDTYFYVILPQGYSFASLHDVQSSTPQASFSEKKYFSSPSASFPFPGVLVKATTAGAQVTSDTLVSISGVLAPPGVSTHLFSFVHASLDGDLTQSCFAMSQTSLASSQGTISHWQVSPVTIRGRGPGGVDVSQIITVVLPHGVNAGGYIEFSLDSNWGIPSLVDCTVTGLNGAICALKQGSTFVITGFQDFSKVESTSVSIFLLHLLAPSLTQSASFKFMTNIASFTAEKLLVDQSNNSSNGNVFVQASLPAGSSADMSGRCFPANAGVGEADLYLSFSMNYDLPEQSVISISVPFTLVQSVGKDRCWLSPLAYSQCAVSSGLKIRLIQSYVAGSTLEVFLRRGVILPTDVGTNGFGFRVAATWAEVEVIKDMTEATPIVLGAKLSASELAGSITLNPTNAGEIANYTLAFKLAQDLSVTDRLEVSWPDEFDPYLGDATERLSQDPGRFYLPCSSDSLGPINCIVDHWELLVQGFVGTPKNTPVALIVHGISTPAAVTGAFRLFHYRADGTLLEFANSLGKVAISPPAHLLQLKLVSVANHRLSSPATHDFIFLLTDVLNATSTLKLHFPPQYDLAQTSYQCNYSYSVAISSSSIANYSEAGSCMQVGNQVSADILQLNSSQLNSSRLLGLTVRGVQTPDFGEVRFASSPTSDFDVQDKKVFSPMSEWTQKFSLFVYESSTQRLLSRTYSNTHGGYLGFKQPLKKLLVNNYDPRDSSSRIVVFPGTQTTELFISTANSSWPLQLDWLVLQPTSVAGLEVTSTRNFNMSYSQYRVPFQVAASSTLLPGLYYIYWTKTEGLRADQSLQFSDAPKTLVEVPPLQKQKYAFSVSEIPTVSIGQKGVPVIVSVPNAPYSDLSVDVSLSESVTGFLVYPTSLVFRQGVQTQNFTLTVSTDFDLKTTPVVTLMYKLTGDDASAFTPPAASKVMIGPKSLDTKGNIVKMGIDHVTRTTATLAPVTDRVGVIYFQLAVDGRQIPSFAELKDMLENPPVAFTDVQKEPGETWASYQLGKYTAHVSEFSIQGVIPMSTTTAVDQRLLEGLWADTQYQVVGYLDMLLEDAEPQLLVESFITKPLAPRAAFLVSFLNEVEDDAANNATSLLAMRMNVDPARLSQFTSVKELNRRRLQTSTSEYAVQSFFSWTLLPDRSIEEPDPLTVCNLTQQVIQDLADDLPENLKLVSYKPIEVSSGVVPTWNKTMEIASYSNTSITVRLRASVPGEECCLALDYVNSDLRPEQVMLGFAYNWTYIGRNCVQVNTSDISDTVYLTNLKADTNYYIHCAATDDLPLWPTQMEYTSTLPMPFIPIHTSLLLQTPDSAADFAIAAVLLLG